MKSSIRTFALVFCALLAAACDRGEDGPGATSPDVTGKIRGRLLLAGGRPAPGAVVKVYGVNYAPWTAEAAKRGAAGLGKSARGAAASGPAFVARTDAEGYYVLDSLERGEYNLLGEKDGLASLQDSVFLSGSQSEIDPDTLLEAGLVQGTVRLQPNHSLETVTLQALGTHVYANADAEGRFALGPLPRGRYRVRVTTTEGQYTVLHQDMEVFPRRRDTLSDTLKPSYTGIPVVTGLRASYDTLAGTATVSWNRARYPQLQAYHVFRSRAGDLALPSQPIAIVMDTFHRDAIFPAGADVEDTTTLEYHYRVKVVNLSDIPGLAFGYVAVKAPPPLYVTTHIGIDVYNHTAAAAAVGGEVSVGDSVRLNLSFRNPGRKVRKIEWFRFSEENPPLRLHELDPPTGEGLASLSLRTGSEPGQETFRVKVTDVAGKVDRTVLVLKVLAEPPIVDAGPDQRVSRRAIVSLKPTGQDRLGRIRRWEWDIGATGIFHEVKDGDTSFTAPDTVGNIPCILRVTDDDGNVVTDQLVVRVRLEWRMLAHAFPTGHHPSFSYHRFVEFGGALLMLGGSPFTGSDAAERLPYNYRSTDGITWSHIDSAETFQNRYGHSALVYKDKVWVMGGQRRRASGKGWFDYVGARDVWSSSDGVKWERVTASGFPLLDGFETTVFLDRMWVVGGVDSLGKDGGIWSSTDGVVWARETGSEPPPWTVGHALIVHGDRLRMVGGMDPRGQNRNDIWSTVDGRNWVQDNPDGRFPRCHGHSVVFLDDRYLLIGGARTAHNALAYGYIGPASYGESPPVNSQIWQSKDGIAWTPAEDLIHPGPRMRTWPIVFKNRVFQVHGQNGGRQFGDAWVLE